MITIINLNKIDRRKVDVPYAFACGRGTPLENPFYLAAGCTRDQSCDKYHEYFYNSMRHKHLFRQAVWKLIEAYKKYGKLWLLCWCAPERCHTETIKESILQYTKELDDA